MAQNPPPQPPPSRAQRATNFLLYGFVISLVLHALVGPFINFRQMHQEEETPQKVTVERIPTPPPTPPPTPTPKPTPPPTPPPKQTPPPHPQTPQPKQPRLKINTQKQESKAAGGSSEATNTHTTGTTVGVPQGQGTSPAPTAAPATPAPPPPPTPTPTPKPSCANPNQPPTTLQAAPPDMPQLAQQQGITGTVRVKVTLDAQSHLTSATVISSPSALLNAAAIQAAKQSTFRTEVRNCVPQVADYVFLVDFESQ